MRPQPGIWVISSSRPRAPVRMVTMRKAAEDMAAHLAAEQARARGAHEHLAEATAAQAAEARRGAGQRAELVAEQAREAVTAARTEATAANARAESASAKVERVRQDADRALGELRASMQREREETAARLAAALEAAQAAATRLDEERTTHAAEAERIERAEAQRDAATAQACAELEWVQADSTWQREELRQVLDGRASVLEEARAELCARAGRAERELDHVRAELAELGRA
jgi:colicin import membrane protein